MASRAVKCRAAASGDNTKHARAEAERLRAAALAQRARHLSGAPRIFVCASSD